MVEIPYGNTYSLVFGTVKGCALDPSLVEMATLRAPAQQIQQRQKNDGFRFFSYCTGSLENLKNIIHHNQRITLQEEETSSPP